MPRTSFRVITAFLAALAIALPAALPAFGADIPDAWFFSGADRPKPLRELEGQPAPEIATKAWIGDETTIASARGKVVVLDFWATWCGPCMAAVPHNVELVNEHRDDGLVFVGVHDSNAGWDKAPGVVRDKGINYPVAQDSGESVKLYHLQFWPTYVVIDRAGIVRAAGLLPDKVGDVVKMLLAEPAPPGLGGAAAAQGAGGGPAAWYYGGAKRPTWLRAAEGKAAPRLEGDAWFGTPLRKEDLRGRVIVMHFLSPDSTIALQQLDELARLRDEFGPQGVVFVGVCDARAPWDKAAGVFAERGLTLPIVHDGPTPDAPLEAGGATAAEPATGPVRPPPPFGAASAELGVRMLPVTVVVDRSGRVAAAGVRADQAKAVVNHLLAQPYDGSSVLDDPPSP